MTQAGTDERIRVVIVDDHEIVRSGLATFLRVTGDLELVGEADSGEEAVRAVRARAARRRAHGHGHARHGRRRRHAGRARALCPRRG